jgi:hypothetical protein
MNCKPGDLAVVVKSANRKNLGKIVRVLRLAVGVQLIKTDKSLSTDTVWQTDAKIVGHLGDVHHFVRDANLRPIRPNNGEDETLQWAGKPESINA